MSRAFTPPSSLSKDDIRTIADIRRDMWTNSFKGIGYGSVAGFTCHTMISFITKSAKLNRNTALLSLMGGGALGSFLAATVTGKNQVHMLHPIFSSGSRPLPKEKDDSDAVVDVSTPEDTK
jgi:hypothetical protein